MLRNLKDLFDQLISPGKTQSPEALAHHAKLASAVLLVHVMQADEHGDAAEQAAVVEALRLRFALSDDEVTQLLQVSQETAAASYDYHRFTSQLNDHFSQEQKIQLVENMWDVAYADARLDENEMHIISKVASLLHVTHGQYIAAKLHAKQAHEARQQQPLPR